MTMRAFKPAALALAAMLAMLTAAAAQQTEPQQTEPQQTEPKQTEPKKTEPPKQTKAQKKATTKEAKKKPAPKAAPAGAQPTLLGQYGDWGAYTATAGGRKVCYALAKPASSQTEPANKPRDPAYMFISTRPAENVHNEVSIVIGYAFKPGFEASADVGGAKFAMYTQQDGAWIKNAAEEARLVDAMRRAPEIIITGESSKGTKSTDKYSLKGLAQALDRVAADCK